MKKINTSLEFAILYCCVFSVNSTKLRKKITGRRIGYGYYFQQSLASVSKYVLL